MTLSITEFEPMLKEYYSGGTPDLLAYKKHALLAMVKKKEDWGGQENKYIIPLWVESAQAVAADFATALANKGNGTYDRFEMGRKKRYGFAQLDRLAMLASKKKPKAFLKAYTAEVDGVISQMGRDAAWNLYRTSTGKRGTVSTVSYAAGPPAVTTLTLANRAEVVGFSVGMTVVASDSAADPGVTAVDTFTARTVDRIDRSGGILYFDGEDLPTAGWGAGDHIHREGDIVTAGTFICLEGLEDHFPETAPTTGDAFQSVDRSVDTDRLAGVRVDASALTIEEGLIDAGMRLSEMGKSPDAVFMNPVRFGQLIKELGSKVVHDKVKAPGKASLGFDGIKVYTPAGTLTVISDPDCPHDVAWMLTMKTLVLASTGKYIHIADDDLKMLRSSSADEYEVRLAAYGNLGCNDPGANCRIKLA